MLKTSGIEVSGDLRIWYSAVQYGTVRYSDSKNQNITCFVFNGCTSRLTDGGLVSLSLSSEESLSARRVARFPRLAIGGWYAWLGGGAWGEQVSRFKRRHGKLWLRGFCATCL